MNDQTKKEEHQVHENNHTNIKARYLESIMPSQVPGFLYFQRTPRSSCKENPHKMRIKFAMSMRRIQQCLLFLGLLSIIIMAAGEYAKLPERHNLTDSFTFSPLKAEMMVAMEKPRRIAHQDSALDDWLGALGFVYDSDLGHVRNPFAFPRAEVDPSLWECFQPSVYFEGLLQPVHSIVLTLPGGGRTALRLMLQAEMSKRGMPFSTDTSASKLSDKLDRIARESQQQQEKFIFLDLDDLNENVDDQIVGQLTRRIFSNDFKSFFFKIFLPVRFRPFTGTYQPLEIRLMVQDLIEIIQQRMTWASGGRKQSLAQICAPELQTLNPDQALARMAATPRELLNLGQLLLIYHAPHWKSEEILLLNRNDWYMMTEGVQAFPTVTLSRSISPQASKDVISVTQASPTVTPSRSISPQELRDIISVALDSQGKHLFITNVVEGKLSGKPILSQDDLPVCPQSLTIDQRTKQEDLGKALFRSLFFGDLSERFQRAKEDIDAQKMDKPIALNLFFQDKKLAQYPWELLFDNSVFLAKYNILEIVRHLQMPNEHSEKLKEVAIKLPLHVMYIAPRPSGLGALASSDRAPLLELQEDEKIKLDEISPATYEKLMRHIENFDRDATYIFHFDGHGGQGKVCPECHKAYSKEEKFCSDCKTALEDGIFLTFENGDSRQEKVSAEKLGQLFTLSKIRVAFISACYSAAVQDSYLQNSIIARSLLAGIPAIIGMQSGIEAGQKEAPSFVKSFYAALTKPEEYPTLVDAMAYGRAALARRSDKYWYVPVLYLRSGDDEGRFFTPQQTKK